MSRVIDKSAIKIMIKPYEHENKTEFYIQNIVYKEVFNNIKETKMNNIIMRIKQKYKK